MRLRDEISHLVWTKHQPSGDPPGTNVVAIPTRDRIDLLQPLVRRLLRDPDLDLLLIMDNGHDAEAARWIEELPPPAWPMDCRGMSLHGMWNLALDTAAGEPGQILKRRLGPTNVTLLNDDVELQDDLCAAVRRALRSGSAPDVAAARWQEPPRIPLPPVMARVCLEAHRLWAVDGPLPRLGGWCMAFPAETDLRFDEGYQWWMGDADLFHRVIARGGRIAELDVRMHHHFEGSASLPHHVDRLVGVKIDDLLRFREQWT